MARGEQSDIQTTNYVQQHAVMPIYRPTGLFIAKHVRAALAANDGFRPVVVTHAMFPMRWMSLRSSMCPLSRFGPVRSILPIFPVICVAGKAPPSSSRRSGRDCVRSVHRRSRANTAVGDGDVIRRALIAELGGDPSIVPSTMAAMSSCRQIQSTVAGFERPVALSPLVTQVGALVHSVDANALLVDASAWHARLVAPFLAANADKRRIVLAFGSTAVPTPPFVDALVDASVALLRKRADVRIIVAASWRTSEFHR
jgi:hypothetical protein